MKTYPYEIEDEGIRFAIPFGSRLVRYKDIQSLRKMSFWQAVGASLKSLKFGLNYPGQLGAPVVFVETTNLRFTFVPTKADEFMRIVAQRNG